MQIAGVVGVTDPDLIKLVRMNSMPGIIAWKAGGEYSGSRSQETAAARKEIEFNALGGQAELDRVRAVVAANPALLSQWQQIVQNGNSGDFLSKIGNAVVSAIPVALPLFAATMVGADIFNAFATTGASGVSGAGAVDLNLLPPPSAGFQAAQNLFTGAENVVNIYDTITGTVTDLAGVLVSTYGAVQGVQLQKAQIDLATAQAQAAQRAATYTQSTQTAAGGAKINWTMIGLAVAAVLGITLLARAK